MSDENKSGGKVFPVGAVLSAYTGILLCEFDDMHEYIQHVFGRPVWTHELGSDELHADMKERIKKSGDLERAMNTLVGVNTLCAASPAKQEGGAS